MIKKICLTVFVLAMLFSCASAPEGFDDAKSGALEAQKRAQDVNAPEDVPARYGEAESALTLAQEKEAAGELEESMELYEKAEINFNVAAAEAEKKQRVDSYMEEVNPLLEELDLRLTE